MDVRGAQDEEYPFPALAAVA